MSDTKLLIHEFCYDAYKLEHISEVTVTFFSSTHLQSTPACWPVCVAADFAARLKQVHREEDAGRFSNTLVER